MAPKFALFTKETKLPLNKDFKNMFELYYSLALNPRYETIDTRTKKTAAKWVNSFSRRWVGSTDWTTSIRVLPYIHNETGTPIFIIFCPVVIFYFNLRRLAPGCRYLFCGIATDKRGYPHNIFLISPRKHMLWVLIRSASARQIRKISAYFG